MNDSITKMFVVVVVLFALLVGWTSRWTVFEASSLTTNPLNRRPLVDDLRIKRGRIFADDGTVLAKSVPAPDHTWRRTYPTGSLFAQPVGYLNALEGQAAGMEDSLGPLLRGQQSGLTSIFGQLSPNPVGDDVYSTLDPKAQRLAVSQLAGRRGAVVALDPRTGGVLAMYANPTYNDNAPSRNGPNISTYNRVTQADYPPGSTFKVVTTTAALDTGKYTPTSIIVGKSPLIVSGVPLQNDGNRDWGPITLTTALVNSVNTVFAQVGEALGKQTMANYMKRFGFYSIPPLDYPSNEMLASGERLGSKLLSPTSGVIDLGRMSIGQDKLTVTPLQMAMVAAAVANGGRLMVPHLVTKVVNQNGQTVQTIQPQVLDQVMKPSTAHELAQMMSAVVEEGTGQPAQLLGIHVAGKTGTADVGANGANITDAWFIGFAPVESPKVVVAAVLEDTPGEFGGSVAAPIAAQMIKLLLSEGR